MTPQDLIAAFDTLAEAPDGVTRLRELVLQLAVRGKLVPQDAGDEPASVLLEKVSQQRAALVKAKQIRKSTPQPPVPSESAPWEVPDTWSWTRFGTVTDARLGKMLDKSKNTGPLRPYLRNANLQWFRFVLDDLKELRLEEAQLDDCTVRLGDLVICEGGEPGRAAVCTPEADGMVYQKALHRARPLADISSSYLAYLLRCDSWSGRLAELFTGATIKHFTGRSLASYSVPLPPLAEQHRIVARVDELMGLLDRLEAARTARDTTRAAARDAALAALREADTPEEVEVAWNRFAERMDDLLCDPADIDPLRQAVLQLAVRGKLVPQSAGDEPARLLLERIATEKGQLAKSKHHRPMQAPTEPFDPPTGWAWALLGGLSHIERGGSPRPIKAFLTDDPDGLNWIKIGDTEIGGKYITSAKQRIRTEGLKKTRMVFPGDFLLTNSMSFGRPYITKIEGCIHDGWLRIHPPPSLNKDYLYSVLSSPYIVAQFKQAAAGAVVMNLNADKVRDVPIPLPPLAEQHRIVARVDELMGLLDRLAQRLSATQTAHSSFASAAVHHLDA